jgi:transcription antitermination factor NusA-like protein
MHKTFKNEIRKLQGVVCLEERTLEQLRQMLKVKIDRVEDLGEELVLYVPKDQVAKAIGSGGAVVHAAELVINRKLKVKESTA